MIRKKSVVIWAFAAFAGMLFSVTPNVQGGDGGRLRLDGAWLVSNPEIGIRGLETITSIDPSGRRAVSFAYHTVWRCHDWRIVSKCRLPLRWHRRTGNDKPLDR